MIHPFSRADATVALACRGDHGADLNKKGTAIVRLVGEQQLGVADHRAGDLKQLLLAPTTCDKGKARRRLQDGAHNAASLIERSQLRIESL